MLCPWYHSEISARRDRNTFFCPECERPVGFDLNGDFVRIVRVCELYGDCRDRRDCRDCCDCRDCSTLPPSPSSLSSPSLTTSSPPHHSNHANYNNHNCKHRQLTWGDLSE